jgi:hypothetical protein
MKKQIALTKQQIRIRDRFLEYYKDPHNEGVHSSLIIQQIMREFNITDINVLYACIQDTDEYLEIKEKEIYS